MENTIIIVQVSIYFLIPIIAQYLVRLRFFSWLGTVALCYVAGFAMNLVAVNWRIDVAQSIAEIVIPIAIPLLLFNLQFFAWLRCTRTVIIAFVLATVSAIASTLLIAPFFLQSHPEMWKMAGMFLGVYTGGTPNVASVGLALEAQESTFTIVNSVDFVVSAAYFVFCITLLKPIVQKWLPRFDLDIPDPHVASSEKSIPQAIFVVVLAAMIVAISCGVSFALFAKINVPFVMFGITALGMAASLVEKIQNIHVSTYLGDYFILVFCAAMGNVTNISKMLEQGGSTLYYCILVVSTTVCIYYVLCFVMRIDVDTAIITSTAAIFGPAFIAPVAQAIGNERVVMSGLTAGLLGYVVGNYAGISIAYLLYQFS
ncbi:DUF819 family protein [Candidatus Uabimicrobium amorphum]|uniref:Beta-carotene 15,15'-monooxygenase n=1 Tax=Uabimicrobium amorphum TaxID=2596890 RepID=A0A5S9IRW1_UABAM|nr:DUF819 family protein [Candidatus Uabimicrobium amorphum]BBM86774.1 beta-carotene 15,15'-monooxygenase [Candidatus Uabimicrobium amorphum]